MIISTIIGGIFHWAIETELRWLTGISAWVGLGLIIGDATRVLRIQVGLLLITGIGLIMYAASNGAEINWLRTASINTGLLTMIASVGFLRLVALPNASDVDKLPTGRRAYLHTLLAVGVFSSVINVSAPILIADRIHQQRPLDRFTAQSITRVFCGMSTWSPFFAAMAAVLTYISDARLLWIIIAGLPFAVVGAVVVYVEARLRYANEMERFVGFPMHLDALLIPLLLLISVLLMAWLQPDISILVVIALSAIGITLGLLTIRIGAFESMKSMGQFIAYGLPRMVNELALFLAAGVLAVGVSAMIEIGVFAAPFTVFDTTTSVYVLGLMLVFAVMGIHPIILISSFTPLLLALHPNPTLLAITYLMAWNLGTGSSFLSGTHLVFQGRYGIPGWKAASWNWPYALVMYFVAAGWLHLIAGYLPT